MSDLLKAESHFAFGENWTDFLAVVDEDRKAQAVRAMERLFPEGEVRGASFLDIGCGSGLHSLAAARLGAGSIRATDIDRNSVSATHRTLSADAGSTPWAVEVISVFDLPPSQFDVVYSWGVLHHTGDMWRAIECAAAQVKPGGLFALALYRKTPLCGAWKAEKALYTKAPGWLRAPWRWSYMAAYLLALSAAKGRSPVRYIRDYKRNRGMNWAHDVHDWLGGYPYESVSPAELHAFMTQRGFSEVRAITGKSPAFGLFGSACDEFVFRRIDADQTQSPPQT